MPSSGSTVTNFLLRTSMQQRLSLSAQTIHSATVAWHKNIFLVLNCQHNIKLALTWFEGLPWMLSQRQLRQRMSKVPVLLHSSELAGICWMDHHMLSVVDRFSFNSLYFVTNMEIKATAKSWEDWPPCLAHADHVEMHTVTCSTCLI